MFLAIVAHENGVVTKYQPFDDEADANAHVARFGGFVASEPAGALLDYSPDEQAKTLTLDQSRVDARNNEKAESAAKEATRDVIRNLPDGTLLTVGHARTLGLVE